MVCGEKETNISDLPLGTLVVVNSPRIHGALAKVVEVYDPISENDQDAEYGDIFYIKLYDRSKLNMTRPSLDGHAYGNEKLIAVHRNYLKPLIAKEGWDEEDNKWIT